MTTDTGTYRGGRFTASILPWLLGAGMFAVYCSTLQRFAGPYSIDRLADVSGWNWQANPFGPITFLVTWPLRLLPAGAMTAGMNGLAALCGALALALLARSVALLPHDRTKEQRQREQNEFSILSIRSAWLPPLFAVLVCGLQLTFWEHATEFRKTALADTGEMINLVIFAFVICQLLEYRIDRREFRLYLGAMVYGLGMANDWALILWLPGFLVAVGWVKGLEFFDWRFLLRMAALGAASLSLLIIFPIINTKLHDSSLTVRQILGGFLWFEKKAPEGVEKKLLLQLALTSVLPVLLIGIRWASSFGDNSRLGAILAGFVFNIIHAFFLVLCLWAALDPPFSPRQTIPWMAGLPFYFLGALSIGYFSGYFLLVFSPLPGRSRMPALLRWTNRVATVCIWLLAVAAPCALLAKNLPVLRNRQAVASGFVRYFSRVTESLSAKGAVVLSDNNSMLHYLRASLAQSGKDPGHLFVDTGSLSHSWVYARRLAAKNPGYSLAIERNDGNRDHPSDPDCLRLMLDLSHSHEIYYLHPSYGYYFELFYPQPDGLIYQMRPYPSNTWLVPSLPPQELEKNLAFWKEAQTDLASLAQKIAPAPRTTNFDLWQWFKKTALVEADTDRSAALLGGLYSRAVNFWGVELQRNDRLDEAGRCFALAGQLNLENRSARLNLDVNRKLSVGEPLQVAPPEAAQDKLGDYLLRVINDYGPLDDPNMCGILGLGFAKGYLYREAIQQLEREQTLLPDHPVVPYQLIQIFFVLQTQPNAISAFFPPADQICSNGVAEADRLAGLATNGPALLLKPYALFFKARALLAADKYAAAIPPLDELLAGQTNYDAYLFRGYAHLKLDQLDQAEKDYRVVATVAPQDVRVAYGLGEIAYQKKDAPAAIKNYELYMTIIPASLKNTSEAKLVAARLEELKAEKK